MSEIDPEKPFRWVDEVTPILDDRPSIEQWPKKLTELPPGFEQWLADRGRSADES
jgi:hypothetical protein